MIVEKIIRDDLGERDFFIVTSKVGGIRCVWTPDDGLIQYEVYSDNENNVMCSTTNLETAIAEYNRLIES